MTHLTPNSFQELYVQPVLVHLTPYIPCSPEAVQLIVGIAAHESGDFQHVKQIGGGPALGYGQIEPATHGDVWKNYLDYRRVLARKVWQLSSERPFTLIPRPTELVRNPSYMVAIMRCILRRAPEPLPAVGDYEGQARYWKQYYHTFHSDDPTHARDEIQRYINRAKRIFSDV